MQRLPASIDDAPFAITMSVLLFADVVLHQMAFLEINRVLFQFYGASLESRLLGKRQATFLEFGMIEFDNLGIILKPTFGSKALTQKRKQ